jgi:hypothetical protein
MTVKDEYGADQRGIFVPRTWREAEKRYDVSDSVPTHQLMKN